MIIDIWIRAVGSRHGHSKDDTSLPDNGASSGPLQVNGPQIPFNLSLCFHYWDSLITQSAKLAIVISAQHSPAPGFA